MKDLINGIAASLGSMVNIRVNIPLRKRGFRFRHVGRYLHTANQHNPQKQNFKSFRRWKARNM